MRNIYFFNPEHDLALADGHSHYLPTKSAKKMAEDLSYLPAWFASDGDAVCVASIAEGQNVEDASFGLLPKVEWTSLRVRAPWGNHVFPWGWDAAVKWTLSRWGVDEALLLDERGMNKLRDFSSRIFAVQVLARLCSVLPDIGFCGRSMACYCQDDLYRAVEGQGLTVLKSPWSSSGKGLRFGRNRYDSDLEKWSKSVLNKQGAVIVEPLYNKVCDFAMEFYSDGRGKVVFYGYSLFKTNSQGAYEGNVLATDDDIVGRLNAFWKKNAPQWSVVQNEISNILSELIGCDYEGYLGVDMMICRIEDGNFSVHPCVEINMRMNMGIVSHMLHERFVDPHVQGLFKIQTFVAGTDVLQWHRLMNEQNPIKVVRGRIQKGYLPLTPIRPDTQYLAYMVI